jgi:hypothetical protein
MTPGSDGGLLDIRANALAQHLQVQCGWPNDTQFQRLCPSLIRDRNVGSTGHKNSGKPVTSVNALA